MNRSNIHKVPEHEPINPGSYNEFSERHGLNAKSALGAYSLALDQYRQDLADFHGITLEELHSGTTKYDQTA
jgi:hypothetical protein